MMKAPAAYLSLLLVLSCGSPSQLTQLRESNLTAGLTLTRSNELPQVDTGARQKRDTLVVEDPEGNKLLLMRAVKDEDGEMVVHEVLDAARVTARFRNVAERGGKVDLRFNLLVPRQMLDGNWQVRLYPDLFVLEDSIRLEPVMITGSGYRKTQLRGYQHYQRFLDSISADSLYFVDHHQLENFLRRNLPQIYRFRDDSTFVSEEEFSSAFGVTQQEALEHYTNELLKKWNKRKIMRKSQVFNKYVKSPILSEGLRLDSVIVSSEGDVSYEYVQTLTVKPGMKKASVVLSGAVFDQDQMIYEIPPVEPLTFYISSLSGLTDPSVRYKTVVIERKVQANTACYIEFEQGSDKVDENTGNNHDEISRIKNNLSSLLKNEIYDLDSILVSASCSPEGLWESNRKLSVRRSREVSKYFEAYIAAWRDSAARSEGVRMLLGNVDVPIPEPRPITFLPRSDAENWRMLDALIDGDEKIGPQDKEQYSLLSGLKDLDSREKSLHSLKSYKYIRSELYPRLRVVRFDFHLTRKGLQKDTVHTTIIDTLYMNGVAAIKDRNYEKALSLLKDYKDYNTAVAYVALDYNASAMDLLSTLEDTDKVLYMKALVYSRINQDAKAVEAYLKACKKNPSMVHRGNLDPEISSLIQKYHIKNENY